jgi:hypothetical protein
MTSKGAGIFFPFKNVQRMPIAPIFYNAAQNIPGKSMHDIES